MLDKIRQLINDGNKVIIHTDENGNFSLGSESSKYNKLPARFREWLHNELQTIYDESIVEEEAQTSTKEPEVKKNEEELLPWEG